MAKPVAYFGYSKTGLTVKFENTSLNNPTTYLWDFGDGSTSNEKSPSHTYNEMGFFTVKLIATNTDGDSEPLELVIGVGDVNDTLNSSILELISHYMPSIMNESTSVKDKVALIQKWQLYLQPLVYIPYEVKEEDTYNEFKWPGLINSLIAQLVSYDIILEGANKFLANIPSAGDINIDTTNTNTENKKRQIKSIETGPAKTEWYQDSDATSTSESTKNFGAFYAYATRTNGLIDQLKQSACQLSQRVRIFLPMCGQLPHNTQAPEVVKHKHCDKHNANPFGITKRML